MPTHLCALAACAAVFFVLSASSASAATPNFCPPGSAAGRCDAPLALAVDQSTGAVYVGETNNGRIDEFNSEGHFLRAFGFGVRDGANALQTCTTLCIAGSSPRPKALAVDNSAAPSAHDVYAFNGSRVEKYKFNPLTEEYELLLSFGSAGTGPGQFSGEAHPIAVDSSGDVWVGDKDRLERFSEEGAFLSEVALPGAGEIQSLAGDPTTGDFYTLAPRRDEQQLIHPPASGTYTLSFEGQTTGELAFDAPPSGGEGPTASVQNALEALSTIGPGNVESFDALFKRFAVIFRGALGNTDVPQITISAGSVETVVDGANGLLAKRKPNGELIETLDASGHPEALALDPATGNLFVGDCPPGSPGDACPGYTLLSYDSSGALAEAFGSGEVIGRPRGSALAFGDSAQRLYVVSSSAEGNSAAQAFALPEPGPLPISGTSVANPIAKTTATLNAEVDPEGKATTCHFQYVTAAQFKADGNSFGAGTTSTPESASIGADFQPHPAFQAISPLTPATVYRFRVVCNNENGTVDGETAEFATLPPAAIDSTSASEVSADSATLEAEINPLGDATSYRFEYLTQAEYEENLAAGPDGFSAPHLPTSVPVPDAPLGAGSADVTVSQHLQNLQPHTAYRFRVVVSNTVSEANGGPFAGPVHAFTTQPFATLGLPDHRAWEQVSPPEKRGADLLRPGLATLLQAAASGDAISYIATAPTEAEPQGNSNSTQLLSARAPGGWSSRDLATPHGAATTISAGAGTELRFFSTDLSLGVLEHFGRFEPSLTPAASEETPYLRTLLASTDPTAFCTQSCYRPLLSACPEAGECPPAVAAAADVPPGIQFAERGECPQLNCGPSFSGASPDLKHVVVSAGALSSVPGDDGGLYLYSADAPPAEALRKLSILPDGTSLSVPSLGTQLQTARNAISADGSRVVFSAANGGHLYLRYNATAEQSALSGSQVDGSQCAEAAKACTLQLDALQGGPGASQQSSPIFQLASATTTKIFFTDSQQLTPDAGAGRDLYEYDLEAPAGERLTDLTPASSGEAAAVQGLLPGASEDGSYLYFVANGVLAHNKVENGNGEEEAKPGSCVSGENSPPPSNTCNLYLTHDGATTFIATLSNADQPSWSGFDGGLSSLTARVSPDGRWLAFMSQRPLTGYDNRDARSGKLDQEVFLYDAAAGGGEGKLICASCNPSSARPAGRNLGGEGAGEADPLWAAADVPGWTQFETGPALYQSRYLSDSGRLFFNSPDALVPADTNGAADVYQYEPPKSAEGALPSDTCTESSPTYSPSSRGCVDLISSGASAEESVFLDASQSGDDVFFLTNAQLAKSDLDTSRDLYDARVDGGFPEAVKPVECTGDACQHPAVPPSHPTPGTSILDGPENEHPAKHKHRKKHHRKKHHKRSHKRAASNHRGAIR